MADNNYYSFQESLDQVDCLLVVTFTPYDEGTHEAMLVLNDQASDE